MENIVTPDFLRKIVSCAEILDKQKLLSNLNYLFYDMLCASIDCCHCISYESNRLYNYENIEYATVIENKEKLEQLGFEVKIENNHHASEYIEDYSVATIRW